MFTQENSDENKAILARAGELVGVSEAERINTLIKEFPDVSKGRLRQHASKAVRIARGRKLRNRKDKS